MVLLPSRELAQQVYEEFNKFSKNTALRSICIVGGVSILLINFILAFRRRTSIYFKKRS